MEKTGMPVARRVALIFGSLLSWGWSILAGGGGLGLLIMQGPWPLTNGWFAFFSGLSACPATAWILEKYRRIRLSGWARFLAAFAFFLLGRIALKIEGRAPFLPDFSH